jgi:orotate phosphoribosyltransferase
MAFKSRMSRRMLTAGAVAAADGRFVFICAASYQLRRALKISPPSGKFIGKRRSLCYDLPIPEHLKGRSMSEVSHKVAEILLGTESIQVYKDKPFVFVSGRISPVYIDCRKLLSFPAEREYIVVELAKKVETDIGCEQIDVVAGGETAGIPFASFVAHLIKKPMIYIRKQPKGYGGTKQIEGILEPGKRVLLVEDLITDGLSKLRFNIGIRGAGAKMTHCLCVFDYASDRLNQHEGKINLAKNDITLHVLANWDDVLDAGLGKKYFSAEQNAQIVDFLQDPENWGRKMGFV